MPEPSLRMRFYLPVATPYEALLSSETHNITEIPGFSLEWLHVSSSPTELPEFLINQVIFEKSSFPVADLGSILAAESLGSRPIRPATGGNSAALKGSSRSSLETLKYVHRI